MSGFLDQLRSKWTAPVTVNLKFRLQYDESSPQVYAFFESTDDQIFYRSAIRAAVGKDRTVLSYVCDGKSGVLMACRFVYENSKSQNVVCFIDKDFDDYLGIDHSTYQNLFVTDYYSVENYLCTEHALDVLLREYILLPEEDAKHGEIVCEFRQCFAQFYEHVLPLMAWAIERRRARKEVVFGNFGGSLSKCFCTDGLRVKPLPQCHTIFRTECGDASDGSEAAILSDVISELKAHEPKKWVRGKFELWVFLNFVNILWNNLTGYPISGRKKIKKTLHLDADNIFSVLAGKVPYPEQLMQFLTSNLMLPPKTT